MDYIEIVEPEEIDGDYNNFGKLGFERAQLSISDAGDPTTFRAFLAAEANEQERQAQYYKSMSSYFHENVSISHEMEAKAFQIMLQRFDDQRT